MRILWATPYNVNSAIARYSRMVADELAARGHRVEILRIEDEAAAALAPLDAAFPTYAPDTLDPARIERDHDLVVVNYGDHMPFHAGALRLAAATPAVAVFHDANMESFLWGLRQRHAGVDALLARWPAPAESEAAQRLLALLAGLASGCVAHGSHYVAPLLAACPGPVSRLSLCYPDIGAVAPAPDASGAFVAACFGMINPNKQPERILRALAADPALRKRARMRFIGPIQNDYRDHLATLAASLGLAAPDFYGWVDDEKLCALIAQTHLLCCLRHPVTEGGSASVITALYSGRPIIVNDVGSYRDIPDALARKVAADDDPAPLAAAMAEIAANPQAAEATAAQAALHARAHYSARAYVDALEPLLDAALARLPALRAARRMGARLHRMGLTSAPSFDDGLAARLDGGLAGA